MRTCAQTCALPEVALQSFGLITQSRLSARFDQPRPASATSRLSGYTASSHCVPFRAALYAINHHVHRYVRVRACHILDAPSTKRSRYDRVHRAGYDNITTLSGESSNSVVFKYFRACLIERLERGPIHQHVPPRFLSILGFQCRNVPPNVSQP